MTSLGLVLTRKRYFAPALVFATLNVLFGTWAIYIPEIKNSLGISASELGLAVLFIALGTLCMIPLVPRFINRFGVGKIVATSIVACCLTFLGPFFTTNYVSLCGSLFLIGLCTGLLDVSVNTLVMELERGDNVHVMSSMHGFFSLGGMLGAGIGTFLIPLVPRLQVHIIGVVVVMILLNLVFLPSYLHMKSLKEERDGGLKYGLLKPMLGLVSIGFLVMAAEGAIVDWSALYLEKVTLAAVKLIGLGYAVFNGMMALGRFFGDGISKRYGSRKILILGCFMASVGFGLVLVGITSIAICGFGLVGLGLSIVVPELLRYAGKLEGISAAEGVSLVAGTGFLGLLLGPVVLGFLAEGFELKSSFVALLLFVFSAGVLSFGLRRE